jgi:hypothetical protein
VRRRRSVQREIDEEEEELEEDPESGSSLCRTV